MPPVAWSSGLSVADFASCLAMGIQPVGYVQGCSVMQWSWYARGYGVGYGAGGMGMGMGGFGGMPALGVRGQYGEEYRCPHGFVGGEHRMYGFNMEQAWVEEAWAEGFGTAYRRMVDEAVELGAHGVIGVADTMTPMSSSGTMEFAIRGTAVRVPDGDGVGDRPFTTFLSGQRLAKLLDAGFVPVSVVAAASSVQMIGYCQTHYQMAGTGSLGWSGGIVGVGSITQVGRARRAARHLAREHVRAQLGGDVLHGATVEQFEHEIGEGDLAIQCTVRGTRVRRYADFGPLPPPQLVVRLS